MNSIDDFMTVQQPTALRPLLGLTVLLIEDSRFASEAMRLLCTKSGRAFAVPTASITHAATYLFTARRS